MDQIVDINEKSLDLPLDNLFNNDTSDDNILQPAEVMPQAVTQSAPQLVPQVSVQNTVNNSLNNTLKGILKNPNMSKQSGQLMQVVQNEPVKQLAQLVQTPQQVTVPNVRPVQNTVTINQPVSQITNPINNSVTSAVSDFKGFGIMGLKISYTTVFITIGVILALVGYYFFTKSRSKNNFVNNKEKEVSYTEQKKVMEKDKKKKKKNKN
jgi:hypothetical protein